MRLSGLLELSRGFARTSFLIIATLLMYSIDANPAKAQGYALTDGPPTPNTLDTITVNGWQSPFSATATYGLDRLIAETSMFGRSPSFIPNMGDGGSNNSTKGTGCGGSVPAKADPIVLSTGALVESEVDFKAEGEMGLHMSRLYSSILATRGILGPGWLTNFDKRLRFKYDTGLICEPIPGNPPCSFSNSSINIWSTRPDGRVVLFLYFAGGFQEAKPGAIARLVHGTAGQDTLYTEDNTVEVYLNGQIQSETNEYGIGWTYTYGGINGTQLQRVVHTSGRQVNFAWSGTKLVSVTDPAGNVYNYGYDTPSGSIGRLISVAPPGQPQTTVGYVYGSAANELYRLKQRTVNGVLHTQFTYDASGRANSSERPAGVERHSFVFTTGTGGAITQVVETNPLGKNTTYAFASNRLTSVTGNASANCPSTYKERAYDANGYETLVTDFKNGVTKTVYNAKGQLEQEVRAFGSPVAKTINNVWHPTINRKLSTTLLGSLRTDYGYHPDNLLASITNTNLSTVGVANQQRTTTFSYTKHPNGMLQSVVVDGPTAGSGDAITYTYNSAGDLVSKGNSLGHIETYSAHNGLGQPGRFINANGGITDYAYDARGRVISESVLANGTWNTKAWYYDAAGRLSAVSAPDGTWLAYTFDAADRIATQYAPESGGTYAQKSFQYNNASLATRIDTQRVSGVVLPGPVLSLPTLSSPATSATGSYNVTWTSVPGSSGYVLEHNVNGGNWVQLASGASTTFAVTSNPNGTYSYRVRACNSFGCGPFSSSATTSVSVPAPAIPTNFLPRYAVSQIPPIKTTFTFSWTGVSGATSYKIQKVVGAATTVVYTGAAAGHSYQNSGGGPLEGGVMPKFQVQSCNASACSAWSVLTTPAGG